MNDSSNNMQFSSRTAFIAGLVGGILVLCTIGFVVFGVLLFRGKGFPSLTQPGTNTPTAQDPTTTTTTPPPTAVGTADIRNVKIDGEPYIGKVDAPVTMAYYRDFQCPFCRQFDTTTLRSIIDKYVTPGTLKIVF